MIYCMIQQTEVEKRATDELDLEGIRANTPTKISSIGGSNTKIDLLIINSFEFRLARLKKEEHKNKKQEVGETQAPATRLARLEKEEHKNKKPCAFLSRVLRKCISKRSLPPRIANHPILHIASILATIASFLLQYSSLTFNTIDTSLCSFYLQLTQLPGECYGSAPANVFYHSCKLFITLLRGTSRQKCEIKRKKQCHI